MLLNDRELQVEKAAARLGCTRRTIYRDLEVLQRAGMPLFQEPDGRRVRWRLDEDFHRSLAVRFTVQEAMALLAGERQLSALEGTVFANAAHSAVEKVRQALAPPLRNRLAQLAARVSTTAGPTRQLGAHRQHLDELLAAIEACEVVRLEYQKLNATTATQYTVEPHHLHVSGSSVYLVGWVVERAAPRIFLLDRVVAVRRLHTQFARRQELGAGVFAQGAFGLWDAPSQRVRLRFKGSAATIVAEQELHPTQRLVREKAGTLVLELELPISPSLKAWVRGFGERVDVLEPKDLINDL